jgi:hypothetical protein
MTAQVKFSDGQVFEGPLNTTIAEFVKVGNFPAEPIPVACMVNGQLRELTYHADRDLEVKVLTLADSDGMRVYRRSLAFLLIAVAHELFPEAQIVINYGLNFGAFYCEVEGHDPFTEAELKQIEVRMGELIDAATSKNQHREISTTLSDFAKEAAMIVQEARGQLIYAGGDDVLAIVPLNSMLDCSKKLSDQFKGRWCKFKEKYTNFQNHNPTLSVGIGISHMLTPMGRQLALAREAEQIAKNNQDPVERQRKNGLAILYQPRSGDRIEFREQWSAEPNVILDKWQVLHKSRELPFRAAFQLRELDRAIGGWCTPGHKLLPLEIQRVLERKRIEQNKKVDFETINAVCKRGESIGLGRLAEELILTQRLAKHTSFTPTAPAEKVMQNG